MSSSDPGQHVEAGGSDQTWLLKPLRSVDEILDELRAQTDRGVAVLGGAFLEWHVRASIKARIVAWDMPNTNQKHKSVKMGAKLIGDDDTGGEIGFLDQCRLAYCLGVIGPVGFRDLERVAQIRNKFAHHMEIQLFSENAKVLRLCNELESRQQFASKMRGLPDVVFTPEDVAAMAPREKFILAVHSLWILLLCRTIREPRPVLPESGLNSHIFW